MTNNNETVYAFNNLLGKEYDYLHPNPDLPEINLLGESQFYIDLAKISGKNILELACGTGRLTQKIANANYHVTGIDISEQMLNIAKKKLKSSSKKIQNNIKYIQGNMSNFNLDKKFSLVIIPFNSFNFLLTSDEQRNTIKNVYNHLFKGGILALHTFDPEIGSLNDRSKNIEKLQKALDLNIQRSNSSIANKKIAKNSTRIERTIEYAKADFNQQLWLEIWRYKEFSYDNKLLKEQVLQMKYRWVYQWEMQYLLELYGFTIIGKYSDFKGTPFRYGSPMIWVAKKS